MAEEDISRNRVRRKSVVRLRGMISGPARAERNCEVRRGIAKMELVKHNGWRKRVRVTVSSGEDCEVLGVGVDRVVERVTGGGGDCAVWRGRRTEVGWGDCVLWLFRVFRLGPVGGGF